MPIWALTLSFLALALPPLTANLDLASTLVLDSQSKERILQTQYAQAPCWQLAGWSDEERIELGSGTAQIGEYTLVWNEATCGVIK